MPKVFHPGLLIQYHNILAQCVLFGMAGLGHSCLVGGSV